MLLQYRAAAAAGFATQLFWGALRIMIFTAFYRSSTAHQPMSLSQTISYIWLGQAFLGLMPWNVDGDIREMARSGSVAYELIRPLDLYTLWFSRAVASRAAPTLLRAVPMLIIAWLILGLRPPSSGPALLAWAAAQTGALFVSAAITALLNIAVVASLTGDGIVRLANSLAYVLSGMVVPIPLMPAWARPLLTALPYRDIVDAPFRIYCSSISPAAAAGVLLHQLIWIVALAVTGRLILARVVARLVVQGG